MSPVSSADLSVSLLDDAYALRGEITALRHLLHQEPEIGLQLPRTQAKVLDALDGLGYEIKLGTDATSITAVLRGTAAAGRDPQKPATVLLRGDMDALPVQELTNLEYTSRIPGAMHACGHDLHTSMLVGAAQLLSARKDQLSGDVVLMFQPGEEGYNGAGLMIGEGVLEASGRIPDAAFGMHVMSALADGGTVFSRPGTAMSSSDGLVVTVNGVGGHGSAPHLAKDPITVTAEMITALQSMVTRQFNVFDPVIISVGVIQAGSKRNIIPESATFEATIRSFSPEAKKQLKISIPRLIESIALAHGLDADVRYLDEYPVTVNDVGESAFARRVSEELLGDTRYRELANPLAASEDFSRILQRVPGAMLFLSAVPAGVDHVGSSFNHSPYAVFDDAVLPDGAALYARLAIDRLAASAANNQFAS